MWSLMEAMTGPVIRGPSVASIVRLLRLNEPDNTDIKRTCMVAVAFIRSWHIRLPDASRGRREEVHKVQLRHFPLTGQRTLTVDGIEVEMAQSSLSQGKGTAMFQIAIGSRKCCVGYRAAPRPGRYYYSCVIDGVVVPELNETVGDGGEGDSDSIPLPGDVSIDCVATARDSFGATFMEFRVVTRCGGRGSRSRPSSYRALLGSDADKAVAAPRSRSEVARAPRGGRAGGARAADDATSLAVVWRRFSAFRSLHFDIVSMLKGSHLLASLPPLPAKCMNPLVNQMGEAFIESRRLVLEAYLRRLLEVPKARASVNLLTFLGLHPISGTPLPWATDALSSALRTTTTNTPQNQQQRRS